MNRKTMKTLGSGILLTSFSATAFGHGLMVDPPARNALCGLDERADTATSAACIEAFQSDPNGSYSFMSVLTHDIGRRGGDSTNVCGFDSETWGGGVTPWDVPTDWPATPISAGELEITWDISWGPHFDDTEDFVYYITKPDFVFNPNEPLSWSDFEAEPFCELTYDDSNPTANPDITAEPSAALFHTRCQVPERSGHHVIYGEWGRNHFTYERFHGCIDVAFGGGNSPLPPPTSSSSVSSSENSSNSSVSSSSSLSSSSSDPSSSSSVSSSEVSSSTPTSSSSITSSSIIASSSSSSSSSGDDGNALAQCEHVITNEWDAGFTGAIRITNTSETAIDGWAVSWEYSGGTTISNLWNANLDGSNPYTAGGLDWNSTILPGQIVEFGFQADKGGDAIQVSEVTGAVCQ